MPDELKNELVHKFCNKAFVNSSKEMFNLALLSGGELSAFIFTPDHAKQLLNLLTKKVEEYEKEFGPLEGRLPSDPMRSPIDLSRPEDEGRV